MREHILSRLPTTDMKKVGLMPAISSLLSTFLSKVMLSLTFLFAAYVQAATVTGSVGATIISPVNITALLAEIPRIKVSTSIGSVMMALPRPMQGLPNRRTQLNNSDLDEKSTSFSIKKISLEAINSSVARGDFVTSLAEMSSDDGLNKLTIAFN